MSGRVFALAVAIVAAIGCSELKHGRCNSASDCPNPHAYTCNLDKLCVLNDAGTPPPTDAGSDARDAAVDKGPPSCVSDASICTGDKPFCDDGNGMCRGCKNSGECQGLDAGTSVCNEADGGAGMCVQCMHSSECQDPATSACISNVCKPCEADIDCAKFAPGVCTQPATTGDAAPPPRRCASDGETIYVNRAGGCSDTPVATDGGSPDAGTGGSMSMPFCSLQPALNAITRTRNVIVITGSVAAGTWTYADQAKGPLLIVGQNTAKIVGTGAPSFSMSSGNVTIRNIDFSQSVLSNGIEASGGMLTLDHVTVQNSAAGGILLDGASFDIENSTIKGNGLAMDGAVSWSGIYVKTVPHSANLNLVTINDNDNAGLQCAGPITGTDVLAFHNMGGVDIGGPCGITSCIPSDASASTMCGSQM